MHRAEILRLRGSHDDAEKEALLACEELRPYLLPDDRNSRAFAPAFQPNPQNVDMPEAEFISNFAGDWANDLARWLTPQATADYSAVDPANIPASRVTGDSIAQHLLRLRHGGLTVIFPNGRTRTVGSAATALARVACAS